MMGVWVRGCEPNQSKSCRCPPLARGGWSVRCHAAANRRIFDGINCFSACIRHSVSRQSRHTPPNTSQIAYVPFFLVCFSFFFVSPASDWSPHHVPASNRCDAGPVQPVCSCSCRCAHQCAVAAFRSLRSSFRQVGRCRWRCSSSTPFRPRPCRLPPTTRTGTNFRRSLWSTTPSTWTSTRSGCLTTWSTVRRRAHVGCRRGRGRPCHTPRC